MGLILTYTGTSPPGVSTTTSTMLGGGTKSRKTFVALHPEWVPASPLPPTPPLPHREAGKLRTALATSAIPYVSNTINNGNVDGTTKTIPSSANSMGIDHEETQSFEEWRAVRPTGRLWDFCENIGRFRRVCHMLNVLLKLHIFEM